MPETMNEIVGKVMNRESEITARLFQLNIEVYDAKATYRYTHVSEIQLWAIDTHIDALREEQEQLVCEFRNLQEKRRAESAEAQGAA